MEEIINQSFKLLDYNVGWDDNIALPISKKALKNAHIFLLSCKDNNIILPEIHPCKDGTIDVSFIGKDGKLLINFQDIEIYLYGENKKKHTIIKATDKKNNPKEYIFQWIKNNIN